MQQARPWASSTQCSPQPLPVRRRLETRVGLVCSTETGSLEQAYSFTLQFRQTMRVMSRDFDCSANRSYCSNRDGTRDDH